MSIFTPRTLCLTVSDKVFLQCCSFVVTAAAAADDDDILSVFCLFVLTLFVCVFRFVLLVVGGGVVIGGFVCFICLSRSSTDRMSRFTTTVVIQQKQSTAH